MGEEDKGVRLQGAHGHEVLIRLPLQPHQGVAGQGPLFGAYIRLCEQAQDELQVPFLRRYGIRDSGQEVGQGAIHKIQPPVPEGVDIHPVGVRVVHGRGGDEQEIRGESVAKEMTVFIRKKVLDYTAMRRGL